MKIFKLVIATASLLIITTASATQKIKPDAIDKIVLAEMQRQFSPGVAISIVKNGHVIKAQGYGFANVEHQAPATAHTFFQLASVGKQFTATLVMLLVRDGKLKLDDRVVKYLSDAPASWQTITVRHLLNHTAGLGAIDPKIDLRKDYSEQELLASIYQVPLQSPPGEKPAYSNLGYQVLGILCSSVGGKFWGDQLQERVFLPLGMQSRVISERDIIPNRAAGYDRFDGVLTNQAWVSPSQNRTADGSVYVTAEDMVRWAQVLQNTLLLTSQEKETMWAPTILNDGTSFDYGFAWVPEKIGGRRIVRHVGSWQGFSTHIIHIPEERLSIIVLMNRSGGQPHILADKLAAHFISSLKTLVPLSISIEKLAKTPLFIRGDMNGWGVATPLIAIAPGLFRTRLALRSGMQQFKIGGAEWNLADLGARFDDGRVSLGKEKILDQHGENLIFEVQKPGDYIIELDFRGKKLPRLKLNAVDNSPAAQSTVLTTNLAT